MPILNINSQLVGTSGVSPSIATIQTNDTEAKVLASGYLNQAVQSGLASFSLPCIACVSTVASAGAQPTTGWYNVSYTTTSGAPVSAIWSLTPITSPGGAILPTITGQLAMFADVDGTIEDSGITAASVSGAITQLGALHQVSVTFNTAEMVTAYDTPLTIVANPLSSQMILVVQASVYTASTGNTAYATGTAPIIQYSTGGTNGAHGAGTIATAAGLVAGDITASTSQVRNLFGFATGAQTGLSGKGLYFSNATGDYTGGTGTNITISVVYQLLTATV